MIERSSFEKFLTKPDRREIEEGMADLEEAETEPALADKQEDDPLPEELVENGKYLEMYGEDHADELYEWYAAAMQRRDREPLEKERFFDHFFRGGNFDRQCMYGDGMRGYLLGAMREGVFIPSHFAPRSMRKGYELFKSLGAGNLPAVLLITDDLAKTLEKMPEWQIENIEIPANFRGQPVKKRIAHNRFPGYEEKLPAMAAEYLKNHANFDAESHDGEGSGDRDDNDGNDDEYDYDDNDNFEER